ncbi:MAG TPA: hypothetical protein VIA18_07460 [Polyangia bacterium]|nr:hypothetical protein [Polyangia bacterium]
MRSSRRAWLAAAVLAAIGVAGAGFAAWRAFAPRPRVFIGSTFARALDGDVTLRAGQPIRVLLSSPRRFGDGGFVELELHQLGDGDRVLQVIPLRATATDDEVVFAMPDVTQLVGRARGHFRVVFVRDGARLAAADFTVPAP